MKIFKQLFIVGLSFYLISFLILFLTIHNIIIHYRSGSFKNKKSDIEKPIELVESKLDDNTVLDTPKPIVFKVVKKDTQVKQKEVKPVKDSNTVNPIQDSLKS
jgi:hypothetical protein